MVPNKSYLMKTTVYLLSSLLWLVLIHVQTVPSYMSLSVTSDSVSDKLGTENWCLLLYVCSLYHPSLHSTYKCFPYDASNVYTTETGDYKDFINICFAVHFLIYIIARCHGNLRQRCDQRTVMLLYKPNECFTSVDC